MIISGLKYLLVLVFLFWAVGYNTLASATGLKPTRYNLVNPAMSCLLIDHVNQSINVSFVEKSKIYKIYNSIPLLLDHLFSYLSPNFIFAEHPNQSGESKNRTDFLFLSILKI